MTGRLPATTDLTIAQRHAAMLEGLGRHQRGEVAELVGVNNSTITRWRALERYQTEVEVWRQRFTGTLEQQIRRVIDEVVDASVVASRSLKEIAEHATTADGQPAVGARVKAAEVLLEHLAQLAQILQPRTVDSTTNVSSTVEIVFKREGEIVEYGPDEVVEVG